MQRFARLPRKIDGYQNSTTNEPYDQTQNIIGHAAPHELDTAIKRTTWLTKC
jgi:hypothetical protein